jgi:hypothetical protein
MTFSDGQPGEEERLREILSRSGFPPTPDLAGRLRRRLRRRRRVRLALVAVAVLLLVLSQLPWSSDPAPRPVEAPDSRSASRVLWEPPVESLDVLNQESDALLAALEQLARE